MDGTTLEALPLRIYTIGYTRKTARDFFEELLSIDARYLVDIRVHNSSHLASFTKKGHIEFFLQNLTDLVYVEQPLLAPSEEMFKRYRSDGNWTYYESRYAQLMRDRRVAEEIDQSLFRDGAVLLCGEPTPERCHRRLAAEFLRDELFPSAQIVHI